MADKHKANLKEEKAIHKILAERIESLKARKQKYSEEHKKRMAKLIADSASASFAFKTHHRNWLLYWHEVV